MNDFTNKICQVVADSFNSDVSKMSGPVASGDYVVASAIVNSTIGIIAMLGAILENMNGGQELCDDPDCPGCSALRQIDEDNPEMGTEGVA